MAKVEEAMRSSSNSSNIKMPPRSIRIPIPRNEHDVVINGGTERMSRGATDKEAGAASR
jgi:hypothetical protein